MKKTYISIPILTKGNFPFWDKITIDTDRKIVSYQKRSKNFFGFTNTSMTFNDIAAVQLSHRNEWIMFSSIDIESKGGEIITVSGLKTEDAKELKYLLDNLR